MKSDSTVALALAKKMASATPTLNWVGAELAMVMDVLQMQDIVAHHLPGKLNTEADWLSRPDMQGPAPGMLKDINIRQLNEAWMLETSLPSPGTQPSLWGRSPTVSAVFECSITCDGPTKGARRRASRSVVAGVVFVVFHGW